MGDALAFARAVACTTLVAALLAPEVAAQTPDPAQVYRDEHGVPHIVANTEEALWYALGYENARDALFAVQVNIKLATGHAAEYLGLGKPGAPADPLANDLILNDFVARVFQTDLAARFGTTGEDLKDDLEAMLGSEQLVDNLEAYAEGLDAYRQRIQDDDPDLNGQESSFRAWIGTNGPEWTWIYENEIRLEHVAAWGPYIKGISFFAQAAVDDPSPDAGAIMQALLPDPEERSAMFEDPLRTMKRMLRGTPASGSNAFAWSFNLTDPLEPHTLHLGDAQGGLKTHFAYPGLVRPDDHQVATRWFAHLVYEPSPPSMDEPINAFGYMFHGSGFLFSFHNEDFAASGSSSNSNVTDTFLLRLKSQDATGVDPSGPPEMGMNGFSYYSYYKDTDGSDGQGDDWVELTQIDLTIKLKSSMGGTPHDVTVSFLDAGPFGIIPNTTPFAVENTVEWHLGPLNQNLPVVLGTEHIVAALPDEPGTIPCLVAYRVPGMPGVDDRSAESNPLLFERPKQAHNDRIATGFYDMLRADDVFDYQSALEGLNPAYIVSTCAADSKGRIFATRSAPIPRRGDDSLLTAPLPAGWGIAANELGSKLLMYRKLNGDREPVPARWFRDRAWDWQYDVDTLEYLKPVASVSAKERLPYMLYDPETGQHVPDEDESPGFATASNDETYYSYKKDLLDNEIWNDALTGGTTYSAATLREIVPKTDFIIDRLDDIVEGGAPLTQEQSRELALDNREFWHQDYDAPIGSPLPGYPTPVRILAELRDASELSTDSILDEAEKELRFHRDLWGALHGVLGGPKNWSRYPVVNLFKTWVEGSYAQQGVNPGGVLPVTLIPYFPDTSGPVAFIRMPGAFPMIDFLWSQMRIGGKRVTTNSGTHLNGTDLHVFDAASLSEFSTLVDKLTSWDNVQGDKYRNDVDNGAALLIEQYRLGFEATTTGYDCDKLPVPGLVDDPQYQEARLWLPIFKGLMLATEEERFPACLTEADEANWLTLVEWALVGPNVIRANYNLETGFYSTGPHFGEQAFLHTLPYTELKEWVFPTNDPSASLIAEPPSGQPIAKVPTPPYDALYYPDGVEVKDWVDIDSEDVNEITDFFLQLGGFTMVPWDDPNPNPTHDIQWEADKLAKMENWFAHPVTTSPPYPATYPLTRNLVRVLFMQRLLEANDFNDDNGLSTYGDLVRTRVFALNDTGLTLQDVACTGPGLTVVGRAPDITGDLDSNLILEQEEKGFQTRLWALGGSRLPIVTIFNQGGGTESYFWNLPGQRVQAFDSPHYDDLSVKFAEGDPVSSHFTDYTSPGVQSMDVLGLPASPYNIPDVP